MVSFPLPGITVASIVSSSPPSSVQASPVATPIWSCCSAVPYRNCGGPRYFWTCFSDTVQVLPSRPPVRTSRAILRKTLAISRSRVRTPASLV